MRVVMDKQSLPQCLTLGVRAEPYSIKLPSYLRCCISYHTVQRVGSLPSWGIIPTFKEITLQWKKKVQFSHTWRCIYCTLLCSGQCPDCLGYPVNRTDQTFNLGHSHTDSFTPCPWHNYSLRWLLLLLLLSRFSRVWLCTHRWQPTRLPCPWDSPGKNTGVDCHFLLQCMKVKSESEVTQSCPTLSNSMDCSLPGSSVHGVFQASGMERVAIAFYLTLTVLPKTSQVK